MPRQTTHANYQFPDGFRLEISTDSGSTWTDIGIIEDGANATLNWDVFRVDAGNYRKLINYARNITMALAPTPVINYDPDVIAKLMPGVLEVDTANTPSAGKAVSYAGTGHHVELEDCQLRMTHYTNVANTTIDWQFTLYNATIDAGATFSWGGTMSDSLDSISVSYTGEPDEEDGGALFNLFKATT